MDVKQTGVFIYPDTHCRWLRREQERCPGGSLCDVSAGSLGDEAPETTIMEYSTEQRLNTTVGEQQRPAVVRGWNCCYTLQKPNLLVGVDSDFIFALGSAETLRLHAVCLS